MTDPLAQIEVTINCQDNVGSGLTVTTYSGKSLLLWSQFGILECNAYRQGGVLRNGIWRGDPGFCQGVVQAFGDFHSSVHSIRASAGGERWIIGNGISPNCHDANDKLYRGLNVWWWTGTRFVWRGVIDPAPLRIDNNDNRIYLSLVGDMAWARNETHTGYVKFDLANMVADGVASTMPPSEEQTHIDGFTYDFAKTDVHHMAFIREGVPIMLNFYPLEDVKRQQDCAIMWNTLKWLKQHNPTLVIPPTVLTPQQFADVPPTHQFYESINSLGAAGIVVGRP